MLEGRRILEAARHVDPREAALVTVVSLEGSGYRRPGARMLATAYGTLVGCISGGCLEADALEHARAVIRDGRTRLVTYDTTDPADALLGVGLGCQGVLRVLVEPLASPGCQAFLAAWDRVLTGGLPVVEARIVAVPGASVELGARVLWSGGRQVYADLLDARLLEALDPLAPSHGYTTVEGHVCVTWQALNPPPLIWLCGAGTDAPAMAQQAMLAGFRVQVRDHRAAYLRSERFAAGVETVLGHPGSVEGAYPTAALLMTHSYEADKAWLAALATAPLAYLGLLGPRRRAVQMLHDMGYAGWPERLHAPMGLDIGAETPEEVAIATLAELKAVLAGRAAGFLRDRTGAIHPESAPACPTI